MKNINFDNPATNEQMNIGNHVTDAQLLRESAQRLRQPQGGDLPGGGAPPAGGAQPKVPRHRRLHPVPLTARQGALRRRHQGGNSIDKHLARVSR